MKLSDVLLNRKRTEPIEEESLEVWQEEIEAISLDLITAGKYQPRQEFGEKALLELAESIKVHGLLQPIVVRRTSEGYELIVGERRFRACKSLGWEVIPAIVRDADDKEAGELGLIENLQRADLKIFEIADGYDRLINEFGLTQDELARRLGISQANVANKIRLLRLPLSVREIISREMLSERHARALLRIEDEQEQLNLLEKILSDELNVKMTEELVRSHLEPKPEPEQKLKGKRTLILKDLRLFTNSVRELTSTLEASGLAVEFDEREDDEVYELLVSIRKPQGGGGNG